MEVVKVPLHRYFCDIMIQRGLSRLVVSISKILTHQLWGNMLEQWVRWVCWRPRGKSLTKRCAIRFMWDVWRKNRILRRGVQDLFTVIYPSSQTISLKKNQVALMWWLFSHVCFCYQHGLELCNNYLTYIASGNSPDLSGMEVYPINQELLFLRVLL